MIKAPFCTSMRVNEKGFSPIEVLLATTLFGFLVTALIGVLIYGQTSVNSYGNTTQAYSLSDEALEATRNIRDEQFIALLSGTHGLQAGAGTWQLSGTSDSTAGYTRSVTITNSGADRRDVTGSVIRTKSNGRQSTISMTARLTNWAAYIKNWSSSRTAGSIDVAGSGNGLKVATSGSYAYFIKANTLLAGNPDFSVFDISNPSSPTLVSMIELPGDLINISVAGNYAYITSNDSSRELQVIDISNPSSPTAVATYNAPGGATATGIFAKGNTAILTTGADLLANEVFILNISNPLSPTLLGSLNTGQNMNEAYISGNTAYVTSDNDGSELHVIDITNPASPSLVRTIDFVGTANALTIDGHQSKLYVGQGSTVRSLDISTATNPVVTGTIATSGSGIINDLVIEGELQRYVLLGTTTATAEFQTVLIDNTGTMSIASTIDVAGAASSVNGLAYSLERRVAIAVSSSDTQELLIMEKN